MQITHLPFVKMNAKYIRDKKDLITNDRVQIRLRNGAVFTGPLEGVAEFIRLEGSSMISSMDSTGEKVGVFLTYFPSNQRERDILSFLVRRTVTKGECYTFATRWPAVEFYKDLKQAGVKNPKFGYAMIKRA